MFHLRVLYFKLAYLIDCLRDVCTMQVRIFMPFNRAARMSSLIPSMPQSSQAESSGAGIRALVSTAAASAHARSTALVSGLASTSKSLHGTRSNATRVETELKAARPTAYAAGLGLLKRSESLRRTLPAPRRLPLRNLQTSPKPGAGQRVLAYALEDGSAALQHEDAEAAAHMQAAGMHRSMSASSSDQLCARTARDFGASQHAVENLQDVDSVAVDLAEPKSSVADIAMHGGPAMTEGDDDITVTPSGASTPASKSRVTENSISTQGAGPAEPAKPLHATPSLGAALAHFTRMSQLRPDPAPDSAAVQEALPLASALARLTHASLERVRQLRRTASGARGRSGNLESVARDASSAEAGLADAGQNGSSALLLGGELLVTVVDAQVAISLCFAQDWSLIAFTICACCTQIIRACLVVMHCTRRLSKQLFMLVPQKSVYAQSVLRRDRGSWTLGNRLLGCSA